MTHLPFTVDQDYIIAIRRELHQVPELAFDLPRTTAIVKRELDRIGVPYSEAFGKGSVVGILDGSGSGSGFTIGIRADMDALPVLETNDLPYKSTIKGQMHACGHDAHTAMLLGAAKALAAIKDQLTCRVKFLFQPSEEGRESGALQMVRHGVMDDVDFIIGQHVYTELPTGYVGVCPGMSQAASRTLQIRFTGKAAHAAQPHNGIDALAMAVRTYTSVQLVLTREINPLEQYLCSFGKLTAGTTQNVIPAQAELLGTVRTFSPEVDGHILRRLEQIARQAADETGGQAEVTTHLKCLPVYNDPEACSLWRMSAAKLVDEEYIRDVPKQISSEDFSIFLKEKPGVFFRLGIRNEAKNCTAKPHNSTFMVDEDALGLGSSLFVQFVLDHMHGIQMAAHESLSIWSV